MFGGDSESLSRPRFRTRAELFSIDAVDNDLNAIRVDPHFEQSPSEMTTHSDHRIRRADRFDRWLLPCGMLIEHQYVRSMAFHHNWQPVSLRQLNRRPAVGIRPWREHDIR